MEKQGQKDEDLKAKIFDAYTKYHETPASDRRQTYLGHLSMHVFKWCKFYLFPKEKHLLYKETDDVELEFYRAVKRCTDKDKMPEEEFFPYLYKALVNAKNQYLRDQVTESSLKEPRILRKIKGHIKTLESNLGREPTQDEQYFFISQVMTEIKKEETIRNYLRSLASAGVKFKNNTRIDKKGNEVSIFDKIESHHSTYEKELMDDSIAEIFKEEFEKLINKQQDGTAKLFYRAIYTLECIKKIQDYQKIRSVLDGEILEICEKGGKLPTQYEICLNYYDKKESTASSYASKKANKFINDFEEILIKAIQEKHSEIIF